MNDMDSAKCSVLWLAAHLSQRFEQAFHALFGRVCHYIVVVKNQAKHKSKGESEKKLYSLEIFAKLNLIILHF